MWCIHLRQPAIEFWESTPRRVSTFTTAHAQAEAKTDYRFGVVASIIANVNRGKNRRPFKPADFFESLQTKRVQSPGDMRTMFLAVARAAQKRRAS